MKSFLLLPFCLFFSLQTSWAQTIDPEATDGLIHIKLVSSSALELDPYDNSVLGLNLLLVPYGIDTIYKPYKLPGHPLDKVYRIRFTAIALVNELLAALELLAFVEFAEKIPLGTMTFVPNDMAAQQWYLPHINAPAAWNVERGNANVLVAVVDNGVLLTHVDLTANIYINTAEANGLPLIDNDLNGFIDDVNGYDTADKDTDPRPKPGQNNASIWAHGTHVAGIVAAHTDNGMGMAGMAHGCRILPVKAAKNSDNGDRLHAPMDGIYYASRSGADVINMSWGVFSDTEVMRLVVQEAAANGAVLVAAAGNTDSEQLFYPAAYPEVISVGATDQNDLRASFSTYGSTVDVMAPGVSIYSTLTDGGNTYGNLSGTSMAAPIVSGLAALLRSEFPSMTASEVRQRIIDGCVPIDAINPGFGGKLGAGRVDAGASFGVSSVLDNDASAVGMVYPNPAMAGGSVRIIGISNIAALPIAIDMMGREVQLGTAPSGQWVLPADMPPGIYLVQVTTTAGARHGLRLMVR